MPRAQVRQFVRHNSAAANRRGCGIDQESVFKAGARPTVREAPASSLISAPTMGVKVSTEGVFPQCGAREDAGAGQLERDEAVMLKGGWGGTALPAEPATSSGP